MPEPNYIERRRPDPEGLDFEGLTREGTALLQELCGDTWTDYNIHDPGVTILEQVCYALTDLIYRTTFETADYLTSEDGRIDFEKQALYHPRDIFPSHPTTINDYRKVLFDSIPAIHNVWLRTDGMHQAGDSGSPSSAQGARMQGLYRVYVSLEAANEHSLQGADRDQVVDKVRAVYAAHRNLCEDVAEVTLVKERTYTLHANVEVNGDRQPAETLANLYFESSNYISPGIALHPYQEVKGKGKSLEEMLTGPFTAHGYIDDVALAQTRQAATIPELIAIIRGIEDVRFVKDLWFEDPDGNRLTSIPFDPALRTLPRLQFPRNENAVKVRLFKNDRQYRIPFRELASEWDRLESRYRARRYAHEELAGVYAPPTGTFRNLLAYYSIQNHFPALYGINRYGVPESAPRERKAQARQLKAYVLLFEQILANFLAQVQHLPALFSLDPQLTQTYFHQLLTNASVPHVEEIYNSDLTHVDSRLAAIVAGYDEYGDRRNRILDYLLAMYGERFTQRSLRQFNYYYTYQELPQELIRNKLVLLTHLVDISRRRAGAFNYREASWNTENVSSLKQKVGILLGFKYLQARSLTDVFIEKGLELISDDQFERVREGTVQLEYVDLGDIDERVNQPFQEVPLEGSTGADESRLFREIIFLRSNMLSESILRNGIALDRYRIGSTGDEKAFQIVFKPDEGARWYYLASYGTKGAAVASANELVRLLIRLNVESEGLHVIEHILLRPCTRTAHDTVIPPDFYAFKISVIFPSWTARFHDSAFRMLAEETVRLNCPAHISPEFYWLDFRKIQEFERLYMKWLQDMRRREQTGTDRARAEELDASARRLVRFLHENRHKEERNGQPPGKAVTPIPRETEQKRTEPRPPPSTRRIIIRHGNMNKTEGGGRI